MKFFPDFILIFLIGAAALIGIYKFGYLKRLERLIVLILSLNFIVDLVAIKLLLHHKNTNFLYNLLNPMELILTLVIYYHYLSTGKLKKTLAVSIAVFSIFSVVNAIFFQDFFKEFANYSFFVGGILVSLFSYLVWKNDIRNNFISRYNIILWFAAANLVYYTSTIPIMSAHNWLSVYLKSMAFPIYILNKVMYGIWALIIGLGFIWKRRVAI